MELEKAQEWLVRAEETLYDAEMELNNATKGKKKAAKEVFDWANQQIDDAASAVMRAELGLPETSVEDTKDAQISEETSKEE